MDNKFFCAKPNGKLHYPHTMLTGFGFMAVQIAWIIYNAYVPLILRENSTIANLAWSSTAVGIIMVIDNIFGVVFPSGKHGQHRQSEYDQYRNCPHNVFSCLLLFFRCCSHVYPP